LVLFSDREVYIRYSVFFLAVLVEAGSAALRSSNVFKRRHYVMVMMMLSDTVGSVTDVAVTVTVSPVGIAVGAV
jgi:hypothetical protein